MDAPMPLAPPVWNVRRVFSCLQSVCDVVDVGVFVPDHCTRSFRCNRSCAEGHT